MFNTKIKRLKLFGEVIVIGYERQNCCSPLYIYVCVYVCVCVRVCKMIKSVLLSQVLLNKIVNVFAWLKLSSFFTSYGFWIGRYIAINMLLKQTYYVM
jgi:hypothetical protein